MLGIVVYVFWQIEHIVNTYQADDNENFALFWC